MKFRATQKLLPAFAKEAFISYFENRVKRSWKGGHILKGRVPSANSLILSSNDYLSISHHPHLLKTQKTAIDIFGNGQMQSPVFLSDQSLFKTCEKNFANFIGYPSCLLAQSGWSANIGLIQALGKKNLPVYLDFYSHMSLWEGAKSIQAKSIPFLHNSPDSLLKKLRNYGSGIIAVDSIYSTTGTISPIEKYIELANDFNCLLIVDESHSLGTHGPSGNGLVAELGLSNDVHIITASLAKAFSGRGGLIAANDQIIELIRFNALPIIFSSALTPYDLAGFNASLEIISEENWRRKQLHENATFLHEGLSQLGCNLLGSHSQIIPLVAGNEENLIWLRDELEKADIFGAVFCAPATPKNKTLIRLSINSHHAKEELKMVIETIQKIAHKKNNLPLFKKIYSATTLNNIS